MNSSNILGFFLGVLICCFFKKTIYHGPDSNIIRKNISKSSRDPLVRIDNAVSYKVKNSNQQ